MPTPRAGLIRTQVQLTEEQVRALRRMSADRGVSVAELVREAVDTLVRTGAGVPQGERQRRALQAIGRFASGHRDTSARHDEHLEESYHPRRSDVR